MVEKRRRTAPGAGRAEEDPPGQDAAWSRLLTDPRVEAAVASVRRVSGVPSGAGARAMAPPPQDRRVTTPQQRAPGGAPDARAARPAERRGQAGTVDAPARAGGEHGPPHPAWRAPGRPKDQSDSEAGAPQVAEPEPERRAAATAPERRPVRNRIAPTSQARAGIGQEPRRAGPAARRLRPPVGRIGLVVGAVIAVLLHLFVFMAFSAGDGMLIADRLSAPRAVEQLLDSVIRSLQAADRATGASTGA